MNADIADQPIVAPEAEAAVLSALILSKAESISGVSDLEPKHFYSRSHQLIFWVIRSLWREGRPVDSCMVATHLRYKNLLEKVGGTPYLAEIVDATPAVMHIRAHADEVIETARRRDFRDLCREVAHGLTGSTLTTDEAIKRLAEFGP